MNKRALNWNSLLLDKCPRCLSNLEIDIEHVSCTKHEVLFIMKYEKYLSTKANLLANLLLKKVGFKDKLRFNEMRQNKRYGLE